MRLLAKIAVLTALYVATAQLIQIVSWAHEPVSLAWAPAGIALAALLLHGYRLWPGVALGAFIAGRVVGAPVAAAMGIACGETLAVLVAVRLLRKVALRNSLDRPRDVVMLALVGSLCAMISATFGVTSLSLANALRAASVLMAWRDWWLATLAAELVVAPFILTLSAPHTESVLGPLPGRVERVVFLLGLILASALVFFGGGMARLQVIARPYVLFPIFIWGSTRFGVRGAAASSFITACFAITATAIEHGPFVQGGVTPDRLLALQLSVTTIGLAALMLGAIAVERAREALAARSAAGSKSAVLEAALDAVVTMDGDGRIRELNASAERLFGHARAEVTGRSMAELLMPDGFADARQALRSYLLAGESALLGARMTFTARRKGGNPFPAELSITRLALDGSPRFTAFVRDITARVDAERELQRSQEELERKVLERTADLQRANRDLTRREEQLQEAQALALMGSFEWEAASDHLIWSDELYRIFGLPPGTEINFQAFLARIHPEDREHLRAIIEMSLADHQPFGFQERIVRPDGALRVLQSRVKVEVSAGRAVRLLGTCQDVTEQRRAEAARSRLAAIVESSEDAIIGKTLDGHIESWNRGAEKMYGFAADEIIGQSMAVLVPEADHAEVQRMFNRVRDGEPLATFESKRRRKNGSEFDASTTMSLILDGAGRCIGISTITRDVTAHKKAQAKFRRFVEAAPDAMVIMDRAGKIVLANAQTERLFGYTAAELIGINAEILVPERLRPQHVQQRTSYFIEPKVLPMSSGVDLIGLRKNGSEFPMEISVSPIETEDELLVSAAVRDMTERMAFESQLKSSLKEKDVLLREIHHRVKNNLQVIASLLNLQASVIDSEEARSGFEESQSRIQSMALVHQRLYQSKDLASINFAEYLRDLVGRLMQYSGATEKDISFDVKASDIRLDIDASVPCGLVVNELVTNALKHAFPDGRSGHIMVALAREAEGGVVLTVRDDGIGVPFGMRLESVRTLGLQIVRTLAKQLRGSVDMIPLDHGTLFRMVFFPTQALGPQVREASP